MRQLRALHYRPLFAMRGNSTERGTGPETLADILSNRAAQSPQRVAFVFEDEHGTRQQWTYRELDGRARTIAAWLQRQTSPGDRALLVYPPGLEFIATFMGCVYAGVVPVPSTCPKPRRPAPRLDSILADCRPAMALTHQSVFAGFCFEQLSPALSEITWQCTEKIPTENDTQLRPAERKSDDLAFLQYTSGSTTQPRGVMISHTNVLHNLGVITQAFSVDRLRTGDQALAAAFWLPAFHDMGLIGAILAPLFSGATSYLLAPSTFLRRPLRWLEVISETRAAISGAPNFGYELVLRKSTPDERAKLDLRCWKVAFCGAEPIHASTWREFSQAFASAGLDSGAFFPCYGLAEATLHVTGDQRPQGPRILNVDRQQLREHRVQIVDDRGTTSQALVGCGSANFGMAIEIVNPVTLVPCAADEVGEIWVRGDSVARGYWKQDALSADTFQATLASSQKNGALTSTYLRTGDLGFLYEGELFVTGRIKDVIIIRGRNHYPQDIERTAQQVHPAVDLGAAFGVESDDGEEHLVMVHQLRREFRDADLDEILREVRIAIVDEHEVDPMAILFIRPASLPITSSGKVQRSVCRERFLAEDLPISAEWRRALHREVEEGNVAAESLAVVPPDFTAKRHSANVKDLKEELEPWLVAWLTERANLLPGAMQAGTPFAELGIDSLTAVEISQELDQILGMRLPPMVIWSCPTPADLAQYLAEQLNATPAEDQLA